jgi:uncharacterized membrane protein
MIFQATAKRLTVKKYLRNVGMFSFFLQLAPLVNAHATVSTNSHYLTFTIQLSFITNGISSVSVPGDTMINSV